MADQTNGKTNEATATPVSFSSLNDVALSPFAKMLECHNQPVREYTGVSSFIAMTSNYHYPRDNPAILTAEDRKKASEETYYYTRHHNPNFTEFEHQLCLLHGGSSALCFASGMAAVSAVMMALTHSSSTLVCSDEIYHAGHLLLEHLQQTSRLSWVKVNILEVDEVVKACTSDKVKILYFESNSNPNGKVPDFKKLVTKVRAVNEKILIAVDNTFCSPVLFRPFEHGADIIVESVTKYITGKGDVLMGCLVIRPPKDAADFLPQGIAHKLDRWRIMTGGVPSPMSCWLAAKGLETLPLRMDRVSQSAALIAPALASLPCVSRVLHPSLPSHPCHKNAKKYFNNEHSGGIVCFHLPLFGKSSFEFTHTVETSPLLVVAVSLGETHTLLPPGTSGNSSGIFGPEDKTPAVVGEWFRLAVGLQDPQEIIKELVRIIALQASLTTELGTVKKFSAETGQLSLKLTSSPLRPSIGAKGPFFVKASDNKSVLLIDVKEQGKVKSKIGNWTVSGSSSALTALTRDATVYCFTPAELLPLGK